MLARRSIGTIARNRLVPPRPQKTYVKWYMNLADTAHKALVLTCVGVTIYFGVGVVRMFIQSRKNKGELRRRLIEAGVIDEDGRQLLHRLKDEDSWLGKVGIAKREDLEKRIEDKTIAKEAGRVKAIEDQLALEKTNTDRARVGIFDPSEEDVEANRRRREEAEREEDEEALDPRIGVFARAATTRGEIKEGSSVSWLGWLSNWRNGGRKEVDAEFPAQVTENK